MKKWEDAIHYPLRRCKLCTRINKCLRVSSEEIKESFVCKECFESKVLSKIIPENEFDKSLSAHEASKLSNQKRR